VIGLWMRCALSVMVKIRGMSTADNLLTGVKRVGQGRTAALAAEAYRRSVCRQLFAHILSDLIEELGREIGAILPHDRVDIGIDSETPEIGYVPQGFTDGTVQVRVEVHNLRAAVVKLDTQAVPVQVDGINYVAHDQLLYSRGSIWWRASIRWAFSQFIMSSSPVLKRPLQNKGYRPTGQATLDDLQVLNRK
jgi:hypothetical protein